MFHSSFRGVGRRFHSKNDFILPLNAQDFISFVESDAKSFDTSNVTRLLRTSRKVISKFDPNEQVPALRSLVNLATQTTGYDGQQLNHILKAVSSLYPTDDFTNSHLSQFSESLCSESLQSHFQSAGELWLNMVKENNTISRRDYANILKYLSRLKVDQTSLRNWIISSLPLIVSQLSLSQCCLTLRTMSEVRCTDKESFDLLFDRMDTFMEDLTNETLMACLSIFSQTFIYRPQHLTKCHNLFIKHLRTFETDDIVKASDFLITLNILDSELSSSVQSELMRRSDEDDQISNVLRLLTRLPSLRNDIVNHFVSRLEKGQNLTPIMTLNLAYAITYFKIRGTGFIIIESSFLDTLSYDVLYAERDLLSILIH